MTTESSRKTPLSMPNQPLLGVDVDGVVADLVQHLLDEIHERTGRRIHLPQIHSFDFRSTLGDLWEIGIDILSEPGFPTRLQPYPDALQGVEELRKLGRVVFVTTPFESNPNWSHDRTRWLERHVGADIRDVAHLVDKTVFAGELLIDDSPYQLEAWVATGRPAIRVVRPWNHGAPGEPAANWGEVIDITREILQGSNDSFQSRTLNSP